jgi:signal transduction histidine kinase
MNNYSIYSSYIKPVDRLHFRRTGVGASIIMKIKRHHIKSSPSGSDPSVRKLYNFPDWLWRAVIDTFPSNAAILNETGIILYVNHAWRMFANKEGLSAQSYEEGNSYLDFCRLMFGKHSSETDTLTACLRQVMMKERMEICLELGCQTPTRYKWSKVRMARLDSPDSGDAFNVLVLHEEITEQKQAEERLQDLRARLINAQEQERQRIARDLHDDLNQKMAMLSIELELLGQRFPMPADELRQRIRKLKEQIQEIVAGVQRLSYQLHPSNLETLGLVAAIRSLCNEVSEYQVMDVEFSHHSVPEAIHQDVALCLFRIVQESLSNAIKHSGARNVKVELIGNREEIHLTISDSGVGFNPEEIRGKGGLGLVGMQERLRLIGGELSIESQPGCGTLIDARVALTVSHSLVRTESI